MHFIIESRWRFVKKPGRIQDSAMNCFLNRELPILGEASGGGSLRRLPRWLKRKVPLGNADHFTAQLVQEMGLQTVCEHARCPNRMECYAAKTATFMILGEVCTRNCGFCAVKHGQPEPVDLDEPQRVAQAARQLGLRHVVITSVTRDDLPDGGAAHFAQCVRAVRQLCGASVEVLTPDFRLQPEAIAQIVQAAPEVLNHNTETVPRLVRRVRDRQADYGRSLQLLLQVKQGNPAIRTKSGLMLGLGETDEEVLDVLVDLRDREVDFLTLGQYLQPDVRRYLPVERYRTPAEFERLGQAARQLGFQQVASGPFVRSSYHAHEMVAGR